MRSPVRIFLVLLVVTLIGLCGYHRYEVHKRYENISRFDYVCKDSIDYNYYDQSVLRTYLENCDKLTDIAKTLWLKDGIDVTTTQQGYGERQSRINRYNSLLRYTRSLEDKLTQSQDMKDQGLTNDDIEMILDKDITIGAVENEKDKMAAYDFLKGKNVSAASKPNEIWELQKLLNANDYNLSINGVFDASTDSALLDFQKENNLYPSHSCDDITLRKLAE
ncbi:MAG: peptidoglycan-binding protein [Bacteroidetes bacterium]|nr:peptidoglycan-binding protein [Bacteroidota bacterium]